MPQFNAFEEAIDFSFWKETCEKYGTLTHFSRSDYFAHAGKTLQNVGWIISGGFKHSIIDSSGNMKAVGFVFEGAVLANYLSAITGKIMPTDIIALEDSEVLTAPIETIKNRLVLDHNLNLSFVQALFGQAYEHLLNDYRYTPAERYLHLIERYPRIIQLVSLGDIASYLNISYRQLHRIRETLIKQRGDTELR